VARPAVIARHSVGVVTALRSSPSVPLATHLLFFFNDPAPTEISTLSLHDALPIWPNRRAPRRARREPARASRATGADRGAWRPRSEEHTSELQSLTNLVCRLLLEKKKKNNHKSVMTN